jgi:ferredoxin
MIQELRERVRKLFKQNKVDLVIGWEKGSLPLSSTPIFIEKEEDVDKLIFDPTCRNNLTIYLTKDRKKLKKKYKKIGIIVKGCDARSLVLYAVEQQINRDDVIIIGVPCSGVIEKKKIRESISNKDIIEAEIDQNKVVIKGHDLEAEFELKDILSDSCRTCKYPDALEYDIFIGESRGIVEQDSEFSDIDEFEKLPPVERWQYIKDIYSKCVRCYACRNVCPSCYCNECFVDQNDPQWIGKTPEMTDTIIFHLIRNLHIAGRCVDCGACVSACPLDLDLRIMNKKVEKEIKQRFNYQAGIDINEKPAMASYCDEENQDFIMG